MKIVSTKIGRNQMDLTGYLVESTPEIDKNKTFPAVLILPGGAYLATSDREADPVAMRFLAKGYHAFILRYSTEGSAIYQNGNSDGSIFEQVISKLNQEKDKTPISVYPTPLLDVAEAMDYIRKNALEWHVDADKIVVCGFSAGANLAAQLGVYWDKEWLTDMADVNSEQIKPNALILGYPLLDYKVMEQKLNESNNPQLQGFFKISNKAVFNTDQPNETQMIEASPLQHVSKNVPPTYIWHTAADPLVYVEHSLLFAIELQKHGVPWELHCFQDGEHGLSLADETTGPVDSHVANWVPLMFEWLTLHKLN